MMVLCVCVQSKLHMSEYTMEDWLQMERELTRERGLWGPPVGSDLDKWMLDMTEGYSFVFHSALISFIFSCFLVTTTKQPMHLPQFPYSQYYCKSC